VEDAKHVVSVFVSKAHKFEKKIEKFSNK